MSYLGFPRVHFSGFFQADPSTVNNDPTRYDSDRFVARYQRRQTPGNPNGWWNPDGSGALRLRDCRARSVVRPDATTVTAPDGDPLVGGLLLDADDQVSAKLVDLDTQQQMVSEIWGLTLRLHDAGGAVGFDGRFLVAPFADIWRRCPSGARPDGSFGAYYQSVVTDLRWAAAPTSEVLGLLRGAGTGAERLSIKFNVDGYDSDFRSPTFTWGRIVGTIGPYAEGEPDHFVAARMLRPPADADPAFGPAPARLDAATSTLTLDLGNSLPTSAIGGPVQDPGALPLVAVGPGGSTGLVVLGGLGGGFYETQAGVVSVPLDAARFAAAARGRLVLLDPTGKKVLLGENADALWIRADDFVFRMDPTPGRATARTRIFATRHGLAAPGTEVAVQMPGDGGGAPPVWPPTGVPASALTFPPAVVTDGSGVAELELTAAPPGNPRGYIDGQIYSVFYGSAADPTTPPGQLSVLVWDDYAVPDEPTWVDDVQPIFQQFANLYPVMSRVLDLSSYQSVVRYRHSIRRVLELPVDDPNYMPATRDLSPAKRDMILRWLDAPEPPVLRITDLAGLRRAVQLTIELEHATIPPYLCALFSIKPGRNVEVAHILRSVVLEEMLHMGLMCNLLNGLGGSPQIDKPAFVPRYPGHLPGSVRPDLTVSLRRCTKEHVRDVFMAIERPEEVALRPGLVDADETIDVRPLAVDARGAVRMAQSGRSAGGPTLAGLVAQVEQQLIQVEHTPLTIGWFYSEIVKAIVSLSDAGQDLFVGDPGRQLVPSDWPGAPGKLYAITDRASAVLAIWELVRQGEGTSLADPTDDRRQLAHYFKFQEIVKGRRMVPGDDGQWAFEGAPIVLDPEAVFPMADDPDTAALPPKSAARAASELLDILYGDLLRSLQRVFNGSPRDLGKAVGLMYGLEIEAQKLMTVPVAEGSAETAGPAFQPR